MPEGRWERPSGGRFGTKGVGYETSNPRRLFEKTPAACIDSMRRSGSGWSLEAKIITRLRRTRQPCGRVAQPGFDGREGRFSLDGEAMTAMLGADYARDRWLAGMALMQSDGKGDYRDTAAGAGSGSGDNVGTTLTATGLRSEVIPPPEEGSGPALALVSDALWAGTSSDKAHELAASDSDVTRLRLGLEGSWTMALQEGGRVTPKLEAGLRHDDGDAETGFGVELGGGLA